MSKISVKRKVNIELLRIIAMLFIVTHHFIVSTMHWWDDLDDLLAADFSHVNACACIEPFIIIGVNLFFLISGYFGIRFRFSKFFYLILVFYFYVICFEIIGLITGQNQFGFEIIKNTIFYLGEYWYIKVYLIIFLISPFLNAVIDSLNEQKSFYFFCVFIAVFCVLGNFSDSFIGTNGGYSVIFCSGVYVLGGCISRNYILKKESKYLYFGGYIIFALSNVVLCLFCINTLKVGGWVKYLMNYNNPLILCESLCFFKLFTSVLIPSKAKLANIIVKAAQSVFAVYILHSTNRELASYSRMPIKRMINNSWWLALGFCFVYSFVIFFVCVCIDKLLMFVAGRGIVRLSNYLERVVMRATKGRFNNLTK